MLRVFEKNRWLSIIITLVIALVIFILSDISNLSSKGSFLMSVLYHIVIFFLFCLFLFISIKGKKKVSVLQIFLVLIISIVYALFDEVHQSYVIGRSGNFFDVLYNTIGIFFAVFLFSLRKTGKYEKIEEKAYEEDVKSNVNGE